MDAPASEVHFTIGASPVRSVSLTKDLNLLKAALLYADRVKLCSLSSMMILSAVTVANCDPDDQLTFMEEMLPHVASSPDKLSAASEVIRLYRRLRSKKWLNRRESLLKEGIEAQFRPLWETARGEVMKMAQDAGIDGLVEALNTGMVELHTFTGENVDELTTSYFESVKDAVIRGDTFPLLDDETSNLVKLGVQEGHIEIPESGAVSTRHGALVGSLMSRLPSFEAATIGEILDVRRELDRPLVRFRGAVLKFSDAMKAEAWSADFSVEVDRLYVREIEPALMEIEEAIRANSYMGNLTKSFYTKPAILPASFVGMMIANLGSLPGLIEQSFAGLGLSGLGPAQGMLGAAAVGGPALLHSSYLDWKEKNEAIERNQLYFYYRAREELGGG
jgi:hypothetical protein